MAENGLRQVIPDPLANNVSQQPADRSMSVMGVKNPMQTGGKSYANGMGGILDALGNLDGTIQNLAETAAKEGMAQGKIMQMQGKTLADVQATGNKSSIEGWKSMSAVDGANKWYVQGTLDITNGDNQMDPAAYREKIMKQRAGLLKGIENEPLAVKNAYIAAFDDLGPRLAATQAEEHNKWNTARNENEFGNLFDSASGANPDATKIDPNTALAVSASQVRQVPKYTTEDVDNLTYTILGEAAGEGTQGQAAVAQVILNRAVANKPEWGGGSISGVVFKKGQFSTWNGLNNGGNDPVSKFPKGSAAFEKARGIAEQVLSGKVLDPTNGSTYYMNEATVRAQRGTVPSWWTKAVGEAGGVVKIGQHSFAGSKNHDDGLPGGGLKFVHAGQEGIDNDLSARLSATGKQLGIDLTIQSGHRDAAYNAGAGGVKGSAHIEGKAVDINMQGMSDEQKSNLVQTLRANGVKRFITYSKDQNMLHADMSDLGGNGGNWFMYDKKNALMQNAPGWFQQVANSPAPAAPPTVAKNDTGEYNPRPGNSTQLQQLLQQYPGIPMDKKISIVSDRIINQLQAGNDQGLRDIGGIGKLQELGATRTQISMITTAQKRLQQENLNKFNVDREKWAFGIEEDAKSGRRSTSDILAEIDDRYRAGRLSDQDAERIARSVQQASKSAQNSEDNLTQYNPEFLSGVNNLFRATTNGEVNEQDAAQKLSILAQAYNVPKKIAGQYVKQLFSQRQSEWTQLRGQVEQRAREAEKTNIKKSEVLDATSRNMLGTVTGTIGDTNAQQWGVQEMKRREYDSAMQAAEGYAKDGTQPDQAKSKALAEADGRIYTKLRSNGVVDKEFAATLTGMSTHLALNKDGTIDGKFLHDFGKFVELSNNPDIGKEYMDKYLEDEGGRNFFTLARSLVGDDYNLERAARAASEMLANGVNAPKTADYAQYNTDVTKAVGDNWHKLVNETPGMLWGVDDFNAIPTADAAFAANHRNQFDAAIRNQADKYMAKDYLGTVPAKVHVEKAVNDVINYSSVVGGNIIVGSKDKNLQKTMGLEGLDKAAPHYAIDFSVKQAIAARLKAFESGAGDTTGWGKFSYDHFRRGLFDPTRLADKIGGPNAGMEAQRRIADAHITPYSAQYNPTTGQIMIFPWKDATRREIDTTVEPMQFDVRAIGASYKKLVTAQGSTKVQLGWKHAFDAIDAARKEQDQMPYQGDPLNATR